jgi:glycosyltransferase involved in cell wall biosynthesis
LRFYLAGDGDLEKVTDLVNYYHIDEYVTITGWIDVGTKMELLGKAGSVVLPSYEEAFPVSLLEGMAAGKVIIATRISGVKDMITEKQNGFLFDPGDRKALLDIFTGYFSDNNTMIKISENNIKKAETLYDFKIFRTSLEEIYST